MKQILYLNRSIKFITALLAFFIASCNQVFAETGSQSSSLSSILLLVGFFIVFYFMMIRPQMKRNKEQRKMLASIAEGDEILTTSGIIGRITKIGENYHDVEIAEQINVKMQKASVINILPKGTIKASK